MLIPKKKGGAPLTEDNKIIQLLFARSEDAMREEDAS